jgi:hypothetical protein
MKILNGMEWEKVNRWRFGTFSLRVQSSLGGVGAQRWGLAHVTLWQAIIRRWFGVRQLLQRLDEPFFRCALCSHRDMALIAPDAYGLVTARLMICLSAISSRSASSRACLSTASGIFASTVVMMIRPTPPASALEFIASIPNASLSSRSCSSFPPLPSKDDCSDYPPTSPQQLRQCSADHLRK